MLERKNKTIRSARKALYFVLFILFLFVLISSISVYKRVSGAFISSDWIKLSATLIHATIEENRGPSSNASSGSSVKYKTYTPNVLYKYEYLGGVYTGSRVSWVKTYDESDMLRKAQEFKRKLAYNEPISIYINPNNHTESIVYKEVNWHHMQTILTACIIFWLLFLSCIYILKTKLKVK